MCFVLHRCFNQSCHVHHHGRLYSWKLCFCSWNSVCVGCLIGELPMKNVNTSMQILFFLNNFRNFLYCSPKVSITLFKFCKRLLCLQFYGFVFISVYADVLFISRTAQRVCVPVVPESPTAPLGRPKRKQTVSKRKKSNHRGLKLDGAIGQGKNCNSLKSENFSNSFLSHIGKNKRKF